MAEYLHQHRNGRSLRRAELDQFASVGRMAFSPPLMLMVMGAALFAVKAWLDVSDTLENKTYSASFGAEQKTKLYYHEGSDHGGNDNDERRVCPVCDGSGMVNVYDVGLNYLRTETCRTCSGTGFVSV